MMTFSPSGEESQQTTGPADQPEPPVAVHLATNSDWLIRLRWIAGAGVLFGALLVGPVLGLNASTAPLWIMGLVILGYNLVFFLIGRRLVAASASSETYRRFALAQVTLDCLRSKD